MLACICTISIAIHELDKCIIIYLYLTFGMVSLPLVVAFCLSSFPRTFLITHAARPLCLPPTVSRLPSPLSGPVPLLWRYSHSAAEVRRLCEGCTDHPMGPNHSIGARRDILETLPGLPHPGLPLCCSRVLLLLNLKSKSPGKH